MSLTEQQKFNYSSFLTYSTYQKNITETISESKFTLISQNSDLTGFKGALYKNKETGKYTVVFCGTNDLLDIPKIYK